MRRPAWPHRRHARCSLRRNGKVQPVCRGRGLHGAQSSLLRPPARVVRTSNSLISVDSNEYGSKDVALGISSKEHPRTPGFRLCKTGRSRRQGHLRNKAHAFATLRAGNARNASSSARLYPFSLCLLSRLSCRRPCLRFDATMRLCRADHPAWRHPIAAGSRSHSVPPHRAYRSKRRRPYPRSQQVVRA